jgi:hypothetical protein
LNRKGERGGGGGRKLESEGYGVLKEKEIEFY